MAINTNNLTNCGENNICSECGCIEENLIEVVIDGETKLLCQDCFDSLPDRGYAKCPDCGDWFSEDCLYWVEGIQDSVCEDCLDNYYRCDDCGEYFHDGGVYRDSDGRVICVNCYENHNWYCCTDCDRLIQGEDVYWDDNDDPYCSDCYHRNAGVRHNYSFKPDPEFHHRTSEHEDKKLYMGVELEVDCGDNYRRLCGDLEEAGAPIYCKYDGSLGSQGVEIVSHPCTLNYHQYELNWAKLMRTCKNHDYKSHEAGTCGLHVHVNRDYLGCDGDANLVLLTMALWPELVMFSRRKPSQLESWASLPYMTTWDEIRRGEHDGEDDFLTNEARKTERHGRYQAINLTNYSTVEFRLFRGTLKRTTFIATLQLVKLITDYAISHTPTECAHARWSDVVPMGAYKELDEYMVERDLASDPT